MPRTSRKPSPPIANETAPPAEPQVERKALGIREFCIAHGISIDTYFRMQRDGEGPVVMKVRQRTLISAEAAEQWRRSREAAAKSKAAEAV